MGVDSISLVRASNLQDHVASLISIALRCKGVRLIGNRLKGQRDVRRVCAHKSYLL
jgi:hypothetical protein